MPVLPHVQVTQNHITPNTLRQVVSVGHLSRNSNFAIPNVLYSVLLIPHVQQILNANQKLK